MKTTSVSAGLVQFSIGRVLLHFTCFVSDGKLRWHINGVMREMREMRKSAVPVTIALLAMLLGGCTIGYPGLRAGYGRGYQQTPQLTRELHNNLADKYTVQITDSHGFDTRIESGRSVTYKYPPAYYEGCLICLLGKVYDPSGMYMGVVQFQICNSYGVDCTPWIINSYEPKATP